MKNTNENEKIQNKKYNKIEKIQENEKTQKN